MTPLVTLFYRLCSLWAAREPTGKTPLRVAFRRPWPGTRRGLILWFFGIGFILIGGANYLGTPLPERNRVYLQFVLAFAQPWHIGVVFCLVGALTMFTSYCHHNRDHYGYLLASTFSAMWGSVYIGGWLFGDAPVRALGASVLWLIYSAILTACSGLPRLPFAREAGEA